MGQWFYIVNLTRRQRTANNLDKWGCFNLVDEVEELAREHGWDLLNDDVGALGDGGDFYRYSPRRNIDYKELEDWDIEPDEELSAVDILEGFAQI